MIGDYLIVALVYMIGLSFLASIHYFWLRDAFNEEAALVGDADFSSKVDLTAAITPGHELNTSQTSSRSLRSDGSVPVTSDVLLDEAAVCKSCGRFGVFHFGDTALCENCYTGSGSCCPEFGKDVLWKNQERELPSPVSPPS